MVFGEACCILVQPVLSKHLWCVYHKWCGYIFMACVVKHAVSWYSLCLASICGVCITSGVAIYSWHVW